MSTSNEQMRQAAEPGLRQLAKRWLREAEQKELEQRELQKFSKLYPEALSKNLISHRPCPNCDQVAWDVVSLVEDHSELHCKSCSHQITFTLNDALREEAEHLNLTPVECRRCREEVWAFVDLSPNKRAARWKCGYCGKEELVTNYVDSDGDQRDRNIPTHVKRAVYARDQGQCRFCGSQEDLHYDHDLPFSKGGSNSIENIQLLCSRCNLAKKNKIQ